MIEKLKTIKNLKNVESIILEGVHIEEAEEKQIAINVSGEGHASKYLDREEKISLLMAYKKQEPYDHAQAGSVWRQQWRQSPGSEDAWRL